MQPVRPDRDHCAFLKPFLSSFCPARRVALTRGAVRRCCQGKFCPSCRRTACHEVCLKKAFKRGKGRCLNQDCGGAWDVNTEWIEIGQGALDPNDDPDMVHLDKKGKRVAAADAEDDIEDVEGTQQNGRSFFLGLSRPLSRQRG